MIVEHQGYFAELQGNHSFDYWSGQVLHMNDILMFEGITYEKAIKDFHLCLKIYLESCQDLERIPDPPTL